VRPGLLFDGDVCNAFGRKLDDEINSGTIIVPELASEIIANVMPVSTFIAGWLAVCMEPPFEKLTPNGIGYEVEVGAPVFWNGSKTDMDVFRIDGEDAIVVEVDPREYVANGVINGLKPIELSDPLLGLGDLFLVGR
jgi:hypothetical protein